MGGKVILHFSYDMEDIHPGIKKIVTFTRKWFEAKLTAHFDETFLWYNTFNPHSNPNQKGDRRKRQGEFEVRRCQLNDVGVVFIAGGTCRIPFVKKWIEHQFPKAKCIMDGQCEIITATGAAIHALQVLNNEVEPYISLHNTNTSS